MRKVIHGTADLAPFQLVMKNAELILVDSSCAL